MDVDMNSYSPEYFDNDVYPMRYLGLGYDDDKTAKLSDYSAGPDTDPDEELENCLWIRDIDKSDLSTSRVSLESCWQAQTDSGTWNHDRVESTAAPNESKRSSHHYLHHHARVPQFTSPSSPTKGIQMRMRPRKSVGTISSNHQRHHSSIQDQQPQKRRKQQRAIAPSSRHSGQSTQPPIPIPKDNGCDNRSTKGSAAERRPHYAIEKRYRDNLNGKFEELRDYLVSARGCLSADFRLDTQGQPGRAQEMIRQRLSKTRVLGEALEYIRHLEDENDRAMEYIEVLECSNSTHGQQEVLSDF